MKKIAALLLAISLAGCQNSSYYQRTFPLMGTTVSIKTENHSQSIEAVKKSILKMKELESRLNRFDKESEVYKINNLGKDNEINVSEDMLNLIELSIYLNNVSSGAFDITIAPLLDAWNIYSKKDIRYPDKTSIDNALDAVGMQNFILYKDRRSIKFLNPNTKLDFNAVAKGYIVDVAAMLLKDNGIDSGIIDAGGDIICIGEHNKDAWTVGIRDPKNKRKIIVKLKLKNKAVATSGGYENFIIIKNKRYPHIIDPRTGSPVRSSMLSATVISEDCAIADGLATAIFVLGPEEGLNMIEKLEGVDCIIIYEENGKMNFLISSNITESVEIL